MKKILFLSFGIVVCLSQTASATPLESWENTLDGWAVANVNYTSAFSSSLGVTAGTYSLALSGTAGPDYGGMLQSTYQNSYTTELGSSSAVTLDVYTPPGSFAYYLQVQFWINNADTGYQQLTLYLGTTIGSETTLTFAIPTAIAATLSSSSNPTQMGFQVGGGYTAGNETMYLDNLQTVPVPEPATAALMGIGGAGLLLIRRRRAS